jgi:hypothetical protein
MHRNGWAGIAEICTNSFMFDSMAECLFLNRLKIGLSSFSSSFPDNLPNLGMITSFIFKRK